MDMGEEDRLRIEIIAKLRVMFDIVYRLYVHEMSIGNNVFGV